MSSGELRQGHIFSRFDGDLGSFRQLVLDLGQLGIEQLMLGAQAVATGDLVCAQKIRHHFKVVRDMDMDLLEANVQLLALHHPVASDLRFMVTFSRTAYDLERIHQEAIKLADLAESEKVPSVASPGYEMFDDVLRMAEVVTADMQQAIEALADENVESAIKVIRNQEKIERLSQGALRRLATYIMQDPRNIQHAIDVTVALKSIERVADHVSSIAKNLIYACSGKDVRHMSLLNLQPAFLKAT